MATANHVLLRRITLSASASSVTFDSIPQTGYTDLKIVSSIRINTNSSGACKISYNGLTTNMTTKGMYGTGSSATSYTAANNLGALVNGSTTTANTFANSELYIPNYTSANYKSSSMDGVSENNAASANAFLNANLWSSVAAITSITLTPEGGDNLSAGSSFALYGIANSLTTPTAAPKADGGDIIKTDGTYWYHAFLTTGTFRPQLNLTTDCLVIAGGGGGAYGGAGGAGGYRSATNIATLANSNYTVTVGAGGGGGNQSVVGTKGVDSTFSTITSTGGGYGSGLSTTGGGSGGSGGGSCFSQGGGAGNTPSTSPSQGNNGGNGNGYSGVGAGGGGASGGGGSSVNSSTPGSGGSGSNSFSTWATATGTGVSGYYAGGGGGGNANGANLGSGGAGGGGNGGTSGNNGNSGTANTGGGGGGSGGNSGASGGSGIVIIRYPVA